MKQYFLLVFLFIIIPTFEANAGSCVENMLGKIDSLAGEVPANAEDWSKFIIKLPPPDNCESDPAPIIKYITEVFGSKFAYEYDRYHAQQKN